MTTIFLAIAPIFLLIILGHLLRRGGIPSFEFWNLNDKLVYWVLFPSLLFYKIATMDLSGATIGRFAIVVYLGFGAALLFSLIAGRLLRFEPPVWTSVIQGCMRYNTFIALAVAERVYGPEGLALAVLLTALVVPITNVSVVTLMILLLRGSSASGITKAITNELARNPLLIAIALGFLINLSGVTHVPILYDMTSILGAAALPIVLLCVGANIRAQAMVAAAVPTIVSIVGRMIICPIVIAASAIAVGLDTPTTLILMIFGAAPGSANAYTLARQMGGDAPAMASIVTIQTALSFLTMPLTLLLTQHIMAR